MNRKYRRSLLNNKTSLLLMFIALPLLAQNGKSGSAFSNFSPYSISTIVPMKGTMQSSELLNAGLQDNKKSNKLWHNPVVRISLGVFSLVACVAGVVYDGKIKEKADENNRLINEYKALPDNVQYEDYSSRIKNNNSSADSYKDLRNGSYILAGLAGAGFVLTFAF
jgi:hypothetical protein